MISHYRKKTIIYIGIVDEFDEFYGVFFIVFGFTFFQQTYFNVFLGRHCWFEEVANLFTGKYVHFLAVYYECAIW